MAGRKRRGDGPLTIELRIVCPNRSARKSARQIRLHGGSGARNDRRPCRRRLTIQNDIGATDAHVLVVHVEGLAVSEGPAEAGLSNPKQSGARQGAQLLAGISLIRRHGKSKLRFRLAKAPGPVKRFVQGPGVIRDLLVPGSPGGRSGHAGDGHEVGALIGGYGCRCGHRRGLLVRLRCCQIWRFCSAPPQYQG